MINCNTLILLFSFLTINPLFSQLSGKWRINSDTNLVTLEKNFAVNELDNYYVTFNKDSTFYISQGIFIFFDDNFFDDKYPWKYFGNNCRYRIEKNSLLIQNPIKKDWELYKIKLLNKNNLILDNGKNKFKLKKCDNKGEKEGTDCSSIIGVSLKVQDLEYYNVSFNVYASVLDSLILSKGEISSKGKLPEGYFREIINKLCSIDIEKHKNAKNLNNQISSNRIFNLTFYYSDGEAKKYADLFEYHISDELIIALIPLLYSYDKVQ